jgi:hypothetical protein
MDKQYTFIRDGVSEKVSPERWGWGVVYNDGTELKQFGDDGIFHQFKEIDQSKVKMFVMYNLDNQSKRIDVVVDPARTQIFHLYRNFILEVGADMGRRVKVYIFGTKDRKTGVTQYNYILPDDRILKADHDLPDLTRYNI